MDQLTFIRKGGITKRYHTVPTLHTQNVGEHSFQVAMLVYWLASSNMPGVRVELLMAALTHDLAEHKMGDLPAPAKRSLPAYEVEGGARSFRTVWGELEQEHARHVGLDFEDQLTDHELSLLKLADAADGCLHCAHERALGNKHITEVYANFREYVREFAGMSSNADTLIDFIDMEWEKACG